MSIDYKKEMIEQFGYNVFSEKVMEEYLPDEVCDILKQIREGGDTLSPEIADEVANAMKEWATSRKATHYTHWFQPLNGFTAEKHESFISPVSDGGIDMEFSGKMLIRGESDASSFPSGGLRQTFEARGYTTWDCTSPAFLKEDKSGVTLCIPTAFCSYTSEALDEKTPLLRSAKVLEEQSLRLLKLFGDTETEKVTAQVGVEQEYFLVDLEQYQKRKDLLFTGRTLFGARPPKCQELEDYYYGAIDERIATFMKELDSELWKLGILAKTKHNEAAPAQYELAPIYTVANIAADQNQLIMEVAKRVANHHGLVCLLHEKPFEYINGSGKHNNWSICTDSGINVFKPGKTPYDNIRFLLFLSAVLRAIDRHADLLRLSASSASNDHRLGGFEAPPAIISVYLGDDILDVLRTVAQGDEKPGSVDKRIIDFGVTSLPKVYADRSDRNRTSPFAFTGNKFEFRMLGSSMSISWTNTILNTIVAESLDEFCARLESCDDFDNEALDIISEVYKQNGRIIFNGDGYSQDWVKEAERRNLPNLKDTVMASGALLTESAKELFSKYNVYNFGELGARYEITLDIYCKRRLIEARTMLDMAKNEIFPAVSRYAAEISRNISDIESIGVTSNANREILSEFIRLTEQFKSESDALQNAIEICTANTDEDLIKATLYRDTLLPQMEKLRKTGDGNRPYLLAFPHLQRNSI